MADSFFSDISVNLVSTLGSSAVRNLGVWWSYKDELEKLEDTITTIQAVLVDAEEELQPSNQFKVWLAKLRDGLYDAEELVDDFSTEVLRRKVMAGNKMSKEVRLFFSWSSNQFVYGLKMGYKIKEVREKLDVIADNRQKFHFTVRSTKALEKREKVKFNRLEGADYEVKGEILGRDDDKREIVDKHLLREDGEMVISIVGSGGLGKTTLAKLIYNDDEVEKNFELRMWVYVGENNFNVNEIIEKAINSIGDNVGENTEDEQTRKIKKLTSGRLEVEGGRRKRLSKLTQNRRVLLVLDDVWSEDRNEWMYLENLMRDDCGRGSRILVTTRSSNVAKMIGNGELYRLGYLSHEHSKSLFKKIVFGDKETLNPSVEENVEKIVKKCGGVPLAIKQIGNMLRSLNPEIEWLPYISSEISKYPEAKDDIFPTLQLSYHHLPSPLKYCFIFCKLFPKGYEIEVETLVQLWIAQGYVRAPNMSDHENLEDIGIVYCKVLLARCFFQDEKLDEFGKLESLKMHDIMHELTSYIGGEDIVYSDPVGNDVNKSTHHLSYKRELSWSLGQHLDSVLEARKLRTFIALETEEHTSNSTKDMIETRKCNKMLKKMKSLFVLDLHESKSPYIDEIEEEESEGRKCSLKAAVTSCFRWRMRDRVLESISKLKHLRHLDLSYTNIKELPNSITDLQNLRVLKMAFCKKLIKLPKDIGKLVNLQILDCGSCNRLDYMPRGIKKLTSLHTLTGFVVGEGPRFFKSKAGFDELNKLSLLKTLKIEKLGVEKNDLSAAEGLNLKAKKQLRILSLHWRYPVTVDHSENTLQKLEPPLSLEELIIGSYQGMKIPDWFLHLKNLVVLSFVLCVKCEYLPPVSQLPCLKRLDILLCGDLKYMKSEDYANDKITLPRTSRFPCLSTLRIMGCSDLTSMPLFPNLDGELVLVESSLEPLLQTLKMEVPTSTSSSSPPTSSLVNPLSKLKMLRIGFPSDATNPRDDIAEQLSSIMERIHQFSSLQTLQLEGSYLKEKYGSKEAANWDKISHIPNITANWALVQKEGYYQLDQQGSSPENVHDSD